MSITVILGCSEGVRDAQAVKCDPLQDTGCPADTHCRVLAGGETACLAQRESLEGCLPASCPPGNACTLVEGDLNCRPLCLISEGTCNNGRICGYALAAQSPWGVCPAPCVLGECPENATCAPTPTAPYPICVAVGLGEANAPCAQQRCAQGFACLQEEAEPRCIQLCTVDNRISCESQSACTGTIDGFEGLRFCSP